MRAHIGGDCGDSSLAGLPHHDERVIAGRRDDLSALTSREPLVSENCWPLAGQASRDVVRPGG